MLPTLTWANRQRSVKVDLLKIQQIVAIALPLCVAKPRKRGLVLPQEVEITLLGEAAIAKVHGEFLEDPTPTDVITFEGHPEFGVAGEICVSADTAAAYATEHQRDFSEELTLYLVHGWLHLAGYDDLQPAKKRLMRAAEARALKLLHAATAVPTFTLRR